MNKMFTILRIPAYLIIFSSIANVDTVNCPTYCRCSVRNSLKNVRCVEQKLVTVELDIPPTVEWLELSHNIISELGDNIFQDLGLEKIIILDLNHNAISSINLHAFHGLKNIQYIDLSNNHLYRIDPSTFENTPSLYNLMLNSNPLRSIPLHQPFLKSTSLKSLEISHCRLSYFPPSSFSSLPSLERLNISNNNLLMLPEDFLDSLQYLTELDITNTAIPCDFSTTKLLNLAASKSARIIGSPCTTKANEFAINQKKEEPKKFEKMIKINGPLDDYDYDYYYDQNNSKDCICDKGNGSDEFDRLSKTSTVKPTLESTRKASNHDYRSMLWLAFLNGLVTGAALSSSAIICWTYCCKCRFRRRTSERRQNAVQYDNVPCETPPPSYSELF